MRKLKFIASLLAWLLVWALWLFGTRNFHPTFWLAIIVTTSLVLAFAAAAYTNHLFLIPRVWARGNRWRYLAFLFTVMALFTALALCVIRTSYLLSIGPDSDRYGLYKHFAIDLFGMSVHVALAALVVWGTNRLSTKS